MLDSGKARVAEKGADGDRVVHQWLKKAVLLSFRLNANGPIKGGPDGSTWWDKVPSKFDGWKDKDFAESAFAPCRTLLRAAAPTSPRAWF